MSLIAVAILFTSCFFAAGSAFEECGKGTTCVRLSECPHYSQTLKKYYDAKDDRLSTFLVNNIGAVTCDLIAKIPKVCCPNESKKIISCGKVQWNRKLGPDGVPAELDQFPWIALLSYKTACGRKFGCAGVLISDRHVLTAAQCLDSYGDELVSVRLGEYDLRTAEDCVINPELPYCTAEAIDVGIEKQTPHQNYSGLRGPSDFDPVKYDIAVLKLDRSVISDVIQPICLPEPLSEVSREEGTFFMSGWGFSSGHSYPKSLVKLMSSLKQVNRTACEKSYGSTLQKDYMCALSESASRSCVADLGGPLMGFNKLSKMTVVGIHSPEVAQSCRERGMPSTFVDVRNYLDWIELQLL